MPVQAIEYTHLPTFCSDILRAVASLGVTVSCRVHPIESSTRAILYSYFIHQKQYKYEIALVVTQENATEQPTKHMFWLLIEPQARNCVIQEQAFVGPPFTAEKVKALKSAIMGAWREFAGKPYLLGI